MYSKPDNLHNVSFVCLALRQAARYTCVNTSVLRLSMRQRNTKTRGTMRFLFLQEKKQFLGVCLDFNLVEEGRTFEEVKKHLFVASRLHLQTVIDKKLSDSLLNRHAHKKYWEMYESIQKNKAKKQSNALPRRAVASPYYNRQNLGLVLV